MGDKRHNFSILVNISTARWHTLCSLSIYWPKFSLSMPKEIDHFHMLLIDLSNGSVIYICLFVTIKPINYCIVTHNGLNYSYWFYPQIHVMMDLSKKCEIIRQNFSFLLLPTKPYHTPFPIVFQIHDLIFHFVISCVYVHVYRYIFLNLTCSIHAPYTGICKYVFRADHLESNNQLLCLWVYEFFACMHVYKVPMESQKGC